VFCCQPWLQQRQEQNRPQWCWLNKTWSWVKQFISKHPTHFIAMLIIFSSTTFGSGRTNKASASGVRSTPSKSPRTPGSAIHSNASSDSRCIVGMNNLFTIHKIFNTNFLYYYLLCILISFFLKKN